MFEEKSENLMDLMMMPSSHNSFIRGAMKETHRSFSGNGSAKFTTSGNPFVDDFALFSNYLQPRTYGEISMTMQLLWSINPKYCFQQALYCRLVSRTCILATGEKVYNQKGAGLKSEAIWRFMWIALNHPKAFWKNLHLIIAAGSFNDIIELMSLDLQYNRYEGRKLDMAALIKVLVVGLKNPTTSELVKKYMPTIRPKSRCRTVESQAHRIIAVELAKALFPNNYNFEELYRKLKATGTAHEWQRLISQGKQKDIDFDTIPGRALRLLANSKSLANWDLQDKYLSWISSKPVAKFTGYPHELFRPLTRGIERKSFKERVIIQHTIDKQFQTLIEKVKDNSNSLIVALDISGSMRSFAKGTNMSSLDIGKALAVYFSYTLKGPFANHVFTFSDEVSFTKLEGKTPSERFINMNFNNFGSTNFIAVARKFVEIRNTVPEEDFPTGLLCISDGEFNDCGEESNFSTFRSILRNNGFSASFVDNFKLILWDIPNAFYFEDATPKFESFSDAPNNFYISGYDGSIVSFIFGNEYKESTPKTADELWQVAIEQQLLKKVSL
jgi:hypothetical protein